MTKENTPLIETDRLILRRFLETDLEDVYRLYGEEMVNKFLPWFPIKTLEEAKNYLFDTILPCYKKDVGYNYAITLKSDNRVIGYVNIHDIGGSNDLGYALREAFWHTGIVAEACMGVVNRLRSSPSHCPFITATHDINNPHSGGVMKKLGMTYRYSYEEDWQPKNFPVTFRMYQLNLAAESGYTYMEYWNNHEKHFVENL